MVNLTAQMAKHSSLPITVKTRLGWDQDSIKIVEVAEDCRMLAQSHFHPR